jgi:hypothetical protein
MLTHRGIAVDSWVVVDDDCDVQCEVNGDEAQFAFGHRTGSLNLVVSEALLGKLAHMATEAFTRLQEIPPGAESAFSVDPVAE